MERIIMHIDVNNAFLSWTAVEYLKKGMKKDIRNVCSVIGGDEKTRNGIVLAKSIPAKKMGVQSAETLYNARKKCKYLEVYPPDYKLYTRMHKEFINILKEYTPDIEVASIDECYIDYGKVKRLYGNELNFAINLKERIKKELGFTVNIGIANNKLCAKMASDFSKPDKIHTLYDSEIKEKMWPLPIEDLFGIGKQTSVKLKKLNINTINDLANYDLNVLIKYFKNMASKMIDAANGIDTNEVNSEYIEPKGIGNEITFERDVRNIEELNKKLFLLSDMVSKRLRKEKKYAFTISVLIKTNFFVKRSKQKSLKNPVNSLEEIYELSKKILLEIIEEDSIRLVGIRLFNLAHDYSYQTSLFDDINKRKGNEKLDEVVDDVNKKFGKNVIKRASLLEKE